MFQEMLGGVFARASETTFEDETLGGSFARASEAMFDEETLGGSFARASEIAWPFLKKNISLGSVNQSLSLIKLKGNILWEIKC